LRSEKSAERTPCAKRAPIASAIGMSPKIMMPRL
jgi:hypothetical protein